MRVAMKKETRRKTQTSSPSSPPMPFLVDVSDIFYFFLVGEGEGGVWGASVWGSRFLLLKIPDGWGGGVPEGGEAEGPGGCLQRIGEFLGADAKYFFFEAKTSTNAFLVQASTHTEENGLGDACRTLVIAFRAFKLTINTKMFAIQKKILVDVSDIFNFFSARGRGGGSSRRQGWWGRFFIENPRRGWVSLEREGSGRGAGRLSAGNFGGGGGLNIFFRVGNAHQEILGRTRRGSYSPKRRVSAFYVPSRQPLLRTPSKKPS